MPRQLPIALLATLSLCSILRAQSTASAPVAPQDIDLGLKEVTVTLPITHWKIVDGAFDPKTMPFPEVTLSADSAAHHLLLKGPPIRVRAVVEVIQYLDRDNTDLITKSRKLEHANTAAIARLLNDIFSPTSENIMAGGELLAIPAADGKSVIVSGWTSGLQKSMDLLDRLDVPAAPATSSAPAQVLFQFEDTTADAILDFMEKNYALIILRPDTHLTTRITVKVPEPVNQDQAIKLLNAFLTPIGYQAFVFAAPVPDVRTVLRVQQPPWGGRRIPVFYGADPTKIATTDHLITQVIPLTHAKAADVKKQLASFVSSDADYIANIESNSIVITDTSAKIHRYVERIQSLDK